MFTTIKLTARRSGLHLRTVYRIIRKGKIKPACRVVRTNLYKRGTEFGVCVAAHLERAGATFQAMLKVVRFLSEADIEKRIADGEKWLVVAGSQVFLCREDAVLEPQLKPALVAFITVDLEKAWRAYLKQLPPLEQQSKLVAHEIAAGDGVSLRREELEDAKV